MMHLSEPLEDLFARSKKLVLDFSQIDTTMQDSENIEKLFASYVLQGKNPRQPHIRQAINNQIIEVTGYRYLIGQYGEDRRIMLADTPAGKQNRTIHMAIDVFCKNLEPVYAPCDGTILRSDQELGFGEFGHYLILQPLGEKFFIFLGHLAKDKHPPGDIKRGEQIGQLGDFHEDENGGWSRHLHLQILRTLPPKDSTPHGYVNSEDFDTFSKEYPDPLRYFTDWHIR